MNFKKYIEELKRRNVIKSGVAYIIVAWLIVQVASTILPTFEAPPYVMKVLLFLLGIGLPINLIFAWIYDITPEGIKKTKNLDSKSKKSKLKSVKLNKVIIVSLSLAVFVLLVNQFWGITARTESTDQLKGTSLPFKNKISIAVLPFQNLSPDNSDLFYCNGMMQNILDNLSKIPEFIVLPSRTTNLYKDTPLLPTELGEELGVQYILDGTFQKINSQVKVSLALTETDDGRQVWTNEDVTFSPSNLFAVQAQLANQVANQLKITLSSKLNRTLEDSPTKDELAYEYYLRGKEKLRNINYHTKTNSANAISLNEAKLLFNLAIERDTNFAAAYLGLARTEYTGNTFDSNFIKDSIHFWRFEELLNQALALDPELSEGYFLKGNYYLDVLNSPLEAEVNWRKALDKNPNNLDALNALADLYLLVKLDIIEGVRLLKEIEYRTIDKEELYQIYLKLSQAYSKIMDLDMEWYYLEKCIKLNDSTPDLAVPWFLARSGEPEKALAELTKRFPNPDNQFQFIILALYHSQNGQFREAIEYFEQWEKLVDVQSADNWFSINDWHRYGQVLIKTGKDSMGLSLIRRQISINKRRIENNDPNYYDMAGIYSFLNELDSAYYYLDKLYEVGGLLKSWGTPSHILVDDQFENIRSDAKFIEQFEVEKAKMREIRKKLSSVDPNAPKLE